METIMLINFIISIVFTICYAYQFLYILVPLLRRKRKDEAMVPLNKYAVLISARNEASVIGNLIDSIKGQNYPSELVTVFVVADNCTDGTAIAAQSAGAVVYERFNNQLVGKGYALDYLISKIWEDYPRDAFDGFFVFDADNLLDENYIAEMNKTFSAGHRIITSYRNSKNYGSNWISAGYALWFLRESQFLNRARMTLKTSCAVSGTGFLVAREIFEKNGGWSFHLLTEDIEFSVHSIISGEKIAYCEKAMLYDEQPVSFSQSYRQRLRWAKGYLQVFRRYGTGLIKSVFKPSFSAFDMTMTIMPAIIISAVGVLLNAAHIILGLFSGVAISMLLNSAFELCFNAYAMLFIVGAITLISEWKNIHCSAAKKIFYTFTFPLFMFTYIPISAIAIFKKVSWTPIEHTYISTLDQVRGSVGKAG